MKLKAILFLFLLSLLLLFSSCSSSNKYGVRNQKYTEARVKSRPSRHYHYEKEVSPAATKATASTSKPKSSVEYQKRNEVLATASKYLGTPYNYAGKNPQEGFDCSGFANYVFNQNGMNINGPSYELALLGEYRDQQDLQTGDLIFFGENDKINHVGIVSENKNGRLVFIHSSTSAGIKFDEMFSSDYWKSKFLFGRDVISSLFKNL